MLVMVNMNDYFKEFSNSYRCPNCGDGKVAVAWLKRGKIVWRCGKCRRTFGLNVTTPEFVGTSKSIPIDEVLKHQGY